jgi:antitoxin component YwqK of YwqJK toxin-antitoxin module
MHQRDKKIDFKLIALTTIFLSSLILLPVNKCLSEPKTWENLVERKNQFFEKFTNTPFNGQIEVYWPNGNLKESGTIKNGKKDNLWEYFHENGKTKEIEFFTLGKLNGTREQYGSGGQLYIKATYKDGKLDGPWIYIDPYDGWLYKKGQYKLGKKTGTWTYYTILGDIEKKEIWKNGLKIFDSTDAKSS